jgi:tRNA threonylcarbamoyladenosine biosynthesis protein TsaB
MDARRGQFYNALFDTSSGVPERLTPDRAVSAEDLKKELEEYGKNVVFVGDGAKLCYNISIDGVSTFTAPEALRYVRAACVAEIGLRIFRAGGAVTAEELTPFYLRLPQAERELRAKTER